MLKKLESPEINGVEGPNDDILSLVTITKHNKSI